MPLIESNVRGDEPLFREAEGTPHKSRTGPAVAAGRVSVIISACEDGPYCALSAAELASIESEKTREKLKIKADHVSQLMT